MSEKQRLYGDTAGLTAFWLMAGMGGAMIAGHLMLRAMQRMQASGTPQKMMAKGPFGAFGWMFDVTTPAEVQAPAAAPKTPRAKRKVEEAEVVAPLVAAVEAWTEKAGETVEAMVAAGDRFATGVAEAATAPSEAVKAVAAELTETPAPAASDPAASEPVTPEPEAPAALAEVIELAHPGRPTALAAARGAADDLKKIKGVGPKLETVLNGLGYYHFDQIAAWGPEELAAVDETLGGFSGRATRDDWIGQAKLLAAGEA